MLTDQKVDQVLEFMCWKHLGLSLPTFGNMIFGRPSCYGELPDEKSSPVGPCSRQISRRPNRCQVNNTGWNDLWERARARTSPHSGESVVCSKWHNESDTQVSQRT